MRSQNKPSPGSVTKFEDTTLLKERKKTARSPFSKESGTKPKRSWFPPSAMMDHAMSPRLTHVHRNRWLHFSNKHVVPSDKLITALCFFILTFIAGICRSSAELLFFSTFCNSMLFIARQKLAEHGDNDTYCALTWWKIVDCLHLTFNK